jgi:beta-glucanase (GH16 family)
MRTPFRRSWVVGLAGLAVLVSAPAVAGASSGRSVSSAPVPKCGGQWLVKPSGGVWRCSFDDEFNGSALDTTKWVPQQTALSGFHSGPECFVNSPSNISESGGTLNLTVRATAAPFSCGGLYTTQYTSGSVSSYGLFAQAYGRFEVRAKLPAATVRGLQESFWLWPQNATRYGTTWPDSGEIDIAEAYSGYPGYAIPYVHYVAAAPDPHVTSYSCRITDPTAFHTYTAVWTTSTIAISYDGATCLVDSWNPYGLTKPAPFDQPFMLALTQGLGIGTNAFDPSITPLPATTQIDYVRVWK